MERKGGTTIRTSFYNLLRSDGAINLAGLIFASLPPLLVIPILSRLFSPSVFGLFGTAFAAASIAMIFMTGRYETAIVVPKDDRVAASIALSGALVATASALGGIITALIANYIIDGIQLYLAFATIGMAYLGAISQIAVNSAVRVGNFRALALGRSIGATAQAALSVGAGTLELGATGLLAAFSLSYLLTASFLFASLAPRFREMVTSLTTLDIKAAAVTYRKYPLFNVPSEIANSLANHLPVLFFTSAFGPAAAGYLTMFNRVWAGSAIISKGVGEIFRYRAAAEMHRTGSFSSTFIKTAAPLSVVAALSAFVLVVSGPGIFEFLLGSAWRHAGEYAQILAPFVAIQLVASTMSSAFYVSERLRPMMMWQFGLLLAQIFSLWIGTASGVPRNALMLLAASGFIMYGAYLLLSYCVASAPAESARAVRRSPPSASSKEN